MKFIPFLKLKKAWLIWAGLSIGLFVVLGLLFVGLFNRGEFSRDGDNTAIYAFSLEQTMRAHPSWGRYQQLSKEIKVLQGKLAGLGLVRTKQNGVNSLVNQEDSVIQSDLEQLFQKEQQIRAEMMVEALQQREQEIQEELAEKMKKRSQQLNEEIEAAVKEKMALFNQQLQEYAQQVEFEYALKITNIEFKLKVPGLTDEEKKKLTTELKSLLAEKDALLAQRKQAYDEEIREFIDRRQQAGKEELQKYSEQLREEGKRRLELYELRLKKEFEEWRQERAHSYGKEVEARREKHSAELLTLEALQAERHALQVSIKQDIRDFLRELVAQKGPTVVLVDPLVQVGKNDLTSVIISYFQK
ncbi:MAG TPA: hypothetical protein GX391_07295 [Firmicutes bacterium]|nr:hypothetical protein [Bacillota bacterium]HOQ23733.1 hypothetical protein [Bacillota bacterium]HPT66877.1 hypothetical protein [Bacillota bacterium]